MLYTLSLTSVDSAVHADLHSNISVAKYKDALLV